jgi:D-aspartate ligase
MLIDLTASPPALLTMADYCGTLAAARFLGRQGVKVVAADPSRLALARRSRCVARSLECPPIDDSDDVLSWLLAFGEREPGHVLYPTCDEYAWLIALHRDRLGRCFRLYSPPVESIEALLDKKSLRGLCERAGVDTPPTWFPDSEADLEAILREARFPLLMKQRTQILSTTHTKGVLVGTPAEIVDAYRRFVWGNRFGRAIADRRPDMCQPLLQAYFPEAVDGSLLVAGFIDRTGELFTARASNKLLQIPPRLGIALCLEEAPLGPELRDSIVRLCRAAGYFGVFQMEFIRFAGRHLLIDFNPRYYHHLAFEIARGMPLPLFAHLAATGRDEDLAAVVSRANAPGADLGKIFAHGSELQMVLAVGRLAGGMPRALARQWRQRYRAGAIDAVRDPDDRGPGWLDSTLGFWQWFRHPRSQFRRFLFRR